MGGLLPTQAILVACEGIFAYHDTEDLLAFSVQIYSIILKIKKGLCPKTVFHIHSCS